MSEQKQPLMEDVILEIFDGELKETALEFAACLHANGLTPKVWRPEWVQNNYCWRIPYEERYLCKIQLEPNKWTFTFFFGDYSGEFDEGFITAVQENVKICTSCHDSCTSGMDTMIFGKEYKNACSQLTIEFANPDSNTVEHIKSLIEYSKKIEPLHEAFFAYN